MKREALKQAFLLKKIGGPLITDACAARQQPKSELPTHSYCDPLLICNALKYPTGESYGIISL
jgi:hypothetical protein